MSGRWPIVVGIVATCGAACREPKESPASARGSAAEPSATAQRPAVVSAPPTPRLPEPVAPDAAVAVADPPPSPIDAAPPTAAFDSQTRDPKWAPKTEREIKSRFAKLRGGKLEAAECRQTACRLTIAGSEGDIAQTIADLESPRGMHGFAHNVILTAPEKQSDGTIVLRVIASFERE